MVVLYLNRFQFANLNIYCGCSIYVLRLLLLYSLYQYWEVIASMKIIHYFPGMLMYQGWRSKAQINYRVRDVLYMIERDVQYTSIHEDHITGEKLFNITPTGVMIAKCRTLALGSSRAATKAECRARCIKLT